MQDQIRLWELEKNRLRSDEGTSPPLYPITLNVIIDVFFEGYLYTAFASQADYEYVLKYAKELAVVLWENPVKRSFFGSLEGHANIKGFIERRTNANGS